jgi:hypothetical protein
MGGAGPRECMVSSSSGGTMTMGPSSSTGSGTRTSSSATRMHFTSSECEVLEQSWWRQLSALLESPDGAMARRVAGGRLAVCGYEGMNGRRSARKE